MANITVDAKMLCKAFLAGAQRIEAKKEYINELNVFPVPDGDTGTNMTLTIMSAAKEVSQMANPAMKELAKAISSGSLRGARGNSGVILSQLLRGFCKVVGEHKEITVPIAAEAFQRAVETAYKAVMKPKEGTILTVAKGGAERASQLVEETDDVLYFMDEVIKYMDEVLDYTPELLPVLKEAGVVDSGGQGLMEIMKGAYDALCGKEVKIDIPAAAPVVKKATGAASDDISTADIKFGYCTEFIIMLEKEYTMDTELEFKAYLESLGDSIVVVSDDEIVKVHVHTNDPGLAIQKALTYGSLTRMKIDNMREEHNERVISGSEAQAAAEETPAAEPAKPAEPRKSEGFVAVSIGAGMNEIFMGLGVDSIIEGGQTMNPSTEDVLNAIDGVNADTVYVLPNNKNIILAAEQAKTLTEDKNVVVIPSKTVPQGIAALINFAYDKSPEENAELMTAEMKKVKTGQVTYAVRDTSIDGMEIKQGNIMGLDDSTIRAVGDSVEDTTYELLVNMIDEDSELITLYYGEETSEEEAESLASRITESYPDVEVEVHSGNQPIYYYVISVE
ncbi:MAG: DAK2 domain-containing protein [Lachnospiraceae bacterium]|nr:DAK2 domain-containing protein [Lachnospiraceae bacterium]MBQ8632194.1 DAK2 domain-containing protein [Lachnospiraceae bacterium]